LGVAAAWRSGWGVVGKAADFKTSGGREGFKTGKGGGEAKGERVEMGVVSNPFSVVA